jgi:hypothetical protein
MLKHQGENSKKKLKTGRIVNSSSTLAGHAETPHPCMRMHCTPPGWVQFVLHDEEQQDQGTGCRQHPSDCGAYAY